MIVKKPNAEIITIEGEAWMFKFKFCCKEVVRLSFNNGDNIKGSDMAANQYHSKAKLFFLISNIPTVKHNRAKNWLLPK